MVLHLNWTKSKNSSSKMNKIINFSHSQSSMYRIISEIKIEVFFGSELLLFKITVRTEWDKMTHGSRAICICYQNRVCSYTLLTCYLTRSPFIWFPIKGQLHLISSQTKEHEYFFLSSVKAWESFSQIKI